jgi:hypothetical protein
MSGRSRREGGGEPSVDLIARNRLGTSGVVCLNWAKSLAPARSFSSILLLPHHLFYSLIATSSFLSTWTLFSRLTQPYYTRSNEYRRGKISVSKFGSFTWPIMKEPIRPNIFWRKTSIEIRFCISSQQVHDSIFFIFTNCALVNLYVWVKPCCSLTLDVILRCIADL